MRPQLGALFFTPRTWHSSSLALICFFFALSSFRRVLPVRSPASVSTCSLHNQFSKRNIWIFVFPARRKVRNVSRLFHLLHLTFFRACHSRPKTKSPNSWKSVRSNMDSCRWVTCNLYRHNVSYFKGRCSVFSFHLFESHIIPLTCLVAQSKPLIA